jgi:hypothetical protein
MGNGLCREPGLRPLRACLPIAQDGPGARGEGRSAGPLGALNEELKLGRKVTLAGFVLNVIGQDHDHLMVFSARKSPAILPAQLFDGVLAVGMWIHGLLLPNPSRDKRSSHI